MALFGKGMGVMDVIRCDETDYLIWKWKPNGNSAVFQPVKPSGGTPGRKASSI